MEVIRGSMFISDQTPHYFKLGGVIFIDPLHLTGILPPSPFLFSPTAWLPLPVAGQGRLPGDVASPLSLSS